MKMKLLFPILGFAGICCLHAVANDSRIVTADGREIKAVQIEVRSNGDLEYLLPNQKMKKRIARSRCRYAQIPKPASITAADQKFREQQWKTAAALYRKSGAEYKMLGWYAYCVRMEAESLIHTGEKDQAAKLLKNLHNEREIDPERARERALSDNLLADLLIESKQFAEAEEILARQCRLDDPELAFAASYKKAVILQGKGKRKEAALQFYQTALLFPGNPRRAEALFNTWSLLSEQKSPDAGKIADMLKREYPDSVFAKQVSF